MVLLCSRVFGSICDSEGVTQRCHVETLDGIKETAVSDHRRSRCFGPLEMTPSSEQPRPDMALISVGSVKGGIPRNEQYNQWLRPVVPNVLGIGTQMVILAWGRHGPVGFDARVVRPQKLGAPRGRNVDIG